MGSAHLRLGGLQLGHETPQVGGRARELLLRLAGRGLGPRDIQPPLEGLQLFHQAGHVHRHRAADPYRADQLGEIADDLQLLGLVAGNEQEGGVDLRDAGELGEGVALLPELLQGRGAGQRGEAGAPGRSEDPALPHHGLRARGLEVQEVVVEVHVADGPQREDGQEGGDGEHRAGMPGDLIHEGDVHALQPHGPGYGGNGALVPSVHDHEHRGKHGDHGHPGEQDGSAGDEPQLLESPEVRQHEDVERSRGGDGRQQHAGAAARGGDLDGLAQAPPQEQLLLVAEEEVDAVVDADPDDDGDEHHREERQVPDYQGGHPDGPAQAHGEHDEHQHRLAHPHEGDEEEAQGEGEGEHGGVLAVAEGGRHLVVGQGGLPGHPHLDVGEVARGGRRPWRGCPRWPRGRR